MRKTLQVYKQPDRNDVAHYISWNYCRRVSQNAGKHVCDCCIWSRPDFSEILSCCWTLNPRHPWNFLSSVCNNGKGTRDLIEAHCYSQGDFYCHRHLVVAHWYLDLKLFKWLFNMLYTKLELNWTSLQGFCDHNWHFCQCTWVSLEFHISHPFAYQVAGRQLWRQVAGASQFAGSLCATRQILVMTSECSTLTIRGA